MYCSYFLTDYGSGVVYATAQGVVKVEIPDLSRHELQHSAQQHASEPSEITAHAAQLLQRYFRGEHSDFTGIPVLFDGMSPFRKKVLEATRCLASGEICTYGQVADRCGSPGAARAVGGALAANPVPVIIPCHRVVASDGRLTGFSAPGGEVTKRALLKLEGVEFKGLLVVKTQLVMHSNSRR